MYIESLLADLLSSFLLLAEEGVPIVADRVAVEFARDLLGDDVEASAIPDLDAKVDGPPTVGGDGEVGTDHEIHVPIHGVPHELDHTVCAGLDVDVTRPPVGPLSAAIFVFNPMCRHLLSAF